MVAPQAAVNFPDSRVSAITFSLPVNCAPGKEDVVLSPVHKIGDIALQLQVKPQDIVGPATAKRDSIILHCEWPWFKAATESVSVRNFHARQVKLTADVTVQHPTLPRSSISKTMKFAEPLSSHTCSQGLQVGLADSLDALRRSDWLGCCEHLLVVVNVRGDFNILERAGLCPVLDNVLWKMWSDARFADFHIAAKGQELRCHRAVLAAASPVFEAMVDSEMQEGSQAFASIDEMPEDITAMLQFVYTEQIPQDLDCLSILRILRIADCYQLPKLVQVCTSLVLPMVTKDNIAEVLHCLVLLEFIPECKVMSELLFHSIQRDFQLVATIAKLLVKARQEVASNSLDSPCPHNQSNSSMKTMSVGVQCEHVDGPGNSPPTIFCNSGTAEGSHRAADIGAAVLSRESLLRLRGDGTLGDALGYRLDDVSTTDTRAARGPHRRTRRGTHGRNDHNDWVHRPEPAPSYATHDSWR